MTPNKENTSWLLYGEDPDDFYIKPETELDFSPRQ